MDSIWLSDGKPMFSKRCRTSEEAETYKNAPDGGQKSPIGYGNA